MDALVEGPFVKVTLSKRNLLALLEKVDDPSSASTINRLTEGGTMLHVVAEPDALHYKGRPAGGMAPVTEEFIQANGSNHPTEEV